MVWVVVPAFAVAVAMRPLPAQALRPTARPVGVRAEKPAAPALAWRAAAVTPFAAAAAGQRHREGVGALVGALAGGTTLVLSVHRCERRSAGTEAPCGLGYALMPAALAAGALLGAAVGHFVPARATYLPPAA